MVIKYIRLNLLIFNIAIYIFLIFDKNILIFFFNIFAKFYPIIFKFKQIYLFNLIENFYI